MDHQATVRLVRRALDLDDMTDGAIGVEPRESGHRDQGPTPHGSDGTRATRNPTTVLPLSSCPWRTADRQPLPLPSQLPPRDIRDGRNDGPLGSLGGERL